MKRINRGFNKLPSQVAEEIFKNTHQKINFRDEKKELTDYYTKNVKDPKNQISKMNRMNNLNNLKKFK